MTINLNRASRFDRVEIKDLEAQRMMLKLAHDYDKLADRAEDRAARDMPGPSPIPKGR